jgi:hypothetical protein
MESETNPRICDAYEKQNSPFRNTIVNCLRRDCGEFQFMLVFCLLAFGGLLGGLLLCSMNGCSFRPMDQDEVSEGEALEEQARNFADGFTEGDDEQLPTEVDCTDGIDEGEIGVIAQFVLTRYCESALQGSEEEAKAAKARVAKRFAAFSLLKKLGLKLILLVPLVLQGNWVPVGFFAIDVWVLIYCGATGAYCPGSLYNDVHVLANGKRFVRVYRWKRFSLWMKFFVGFQVCFVSAFCWEETRT